MQNNTPNNPIDPHNLPSIAPAIFPRNENARYIEQNQTPNLADTPLHEPINPQADTDNMHQADKRNITRRNLVKLSSFFAAGLILFKGASLAFGWEQETSTDGTRVVGDSGSAWGEATYTDRWIGFHHYEWWWQASSNQYFMAQAACNVTCIYTTELYQCMAIQSYMQWGDENNYHPDRSMWIKDGNDCRVKKYVDGSVKDIYDLDMASPHSEGPLHHTDSWQGAGAYLHWIRRESKNVSHQFWHQVNIYDYYDWGDYVGTAESPGRIFAVPKADRPTQVCPKHTIVNDQSLRGKIVCITPHATHDVCAAPKDGAIARGSAINLCANDDEVCRLWLCIEGTSTQEHNTNRFIPIQSIETALSHADGTLPSLTIGGSKETFAAAQLAQVSTSIAQAHWCVKRDGTYHLFCDCSGQALSRKNGALVLSSQVVFHANGYCNSEWSNKGHWWTITEAQFQGSVEIEGTPAVDTSINVIGLAQCTPRESATYNRASVYYQVKLWRCANDTLDDTAICVKVATCASKFESFDDCYRIQPQDVNCYLIAQVNLFAACKSASWNSQRKDWQFQGTVYSPAFGPIQKAIQFFVDNGSAPCYTDTTYIQGPYTPPQEANAAAHKEHCAEFIGWFLDPACTQRYEPGSDCAPDKLYGYNQINITHALCAQTAQLIQAYATYVDEACTTPLELDVSHYDTQARYGQLYCFPRIPPEKIYYRNNGKTRCLSFDATHIYLDEDATKAISPSVFLTENTCGYYRWIPLGFDGIASH